MEFERKRVVLQSQTGQQNVGIRCGQRRRRVFDCHRNCKQTMDQTSERWLAQRPKKIFECYNLNAAWFLVQRPRQWPADVAAMTDVEMCIAHLPNAHINFTHMCGTDMLDRLIHSSKQWLILVADVYLLLFSGVVCARASRVFRDAVAALNERDLFG